MTLFALRKTLPWLALTLTGSLASAAPAGPSTTEVLDKVEAFVYHCHDGDTCRIKIANAMWVNVRFAGIDAPEVPRGKGSKQGQPLGNEARDFLNKTLQGKSVQIRQVDLDQYNRPVVEVYDKDVVVNRLLIEQGLAEVYRGSTKRLDKAPYFAAEEEARKLKRGIWSVAKYQSPAEFRKSERAAK